MKDLEIMENEIFLTEKIICIDKFEWSSLSPYDTYINGKKRSFKNSYIAHLEKHPKNYTERDIWKKYLVNYPNNIEKTYLEFSNSVIKNERTNVNSIQYDEKNNAINITNINKIRVSLKRSFYDKNKVVISTCHPRRNKKKYYSNSYNSSMMFFNNCHFPIKRKEITILESMFNSNGNLNNFDNKEVDKLIDRFIDDIYQEINKLEYYKKKNSQEQDYYYELTDAFDYEEIIGYIDRLLLSYNYLIGKNPDYIYLYKELIDRFKKVDSLNNIKKYIENNDNESISRLINNLDGNYRYYCTLSPQKNYIKDQIDFIMEKYHLSVEEGRAARLDDDENHLYGYAIKSSTFSHVRDHTRNEVFNPVQMLTFLKSNNIKWEDAKDLFNSSVTTVLSPELFKDTKKRWNEPYSDDELRKLIDKCRDYTGKY